MDSSGDFDLTDEHDQFDDPTELPPHWTPPPDPEFPTGMRPRIDRADLSEPADSSDATTRFSRAELLAARGKSPSPRRSGSPRQSLPARQSPAPRQARQAPVLPAPRKPPAEEVSDDAPTPPAVAVVLPPAVAMKVPSPPVRVVVAHRWQAHHVALAFALGLLTGILGVIAALALA
jgi:hypothetical protein